MTDPSENKRRLMQDIEVNYGRHCNLLMDNFSYYCSSDTLWQTYSAKMIADMDPASRNFNMVSVAMRVMISEESPNIMLRLYLRPSVFKNYLSIYELFINNLLSLWLKAHPGILSERTISFRDFFHAPSKERVIDDVISKEIIGILYQNPRDVLREIYKKFLGKNYHDSLTHDLIAGLVELKALRDVLEHNDGRINKLYIEKAGDKKRGNDGESIEISDDILLESYQLLMEMIEIITKDFQNKLETNPL